MSVPEYKLYFWCAFQPLTEEDSRHNRKPQLKPCEWICWTEWYRFVLFLCLLQFCRSIFFLELVHTVPNNVFEVLQLLQTWYLCHDGIFHIVQSSRKLDLYHVAEEVAWVGRCSIACAVSSRFCTFWLCRGTAVRAWEPSNEAKGHSGVIECLESIFGGISILET